MRKFVFRGKEPYGYLFMGEMTMEFIVVKAGGIVFIPTGVV